MRDPHPANIQGSKVVQHSVEHQVNWGYVAIAISVLAVLYAGHSVLENRDDDELEEGL